MAALAAPEDAEAAAAANPAMDKYEAGGRVSYPLADVLAEPTTG